MKHPIRALFLAAATTIAALTPPGLSRAQAAPACGTPEGVCGIEGGTYRMVLPDGATGPVPALVFLHGWGGSAAGTMKNRSMIQTLTDRGYALVVPDGQVREIRIGDRVRRGQNWSVADGRDYPRDDAAFVAAVIADAATRGIDPGRVLLAGFSRGGSMVWDIACRTPDAARGYAPVAGAFWEPLHEGCAGPVDLFHTHGWADRTVPIEGRSIRGVVTQGDVFESLAILREAAGCTLRQPDESRIVDGPDGPRWLRHWTSCADGRRLDLMLHAGGHGVPKGWLPRTLDWFEALGPERRAER